MLVTNNIISTVIIPANFNDYSYEFAVFSNTCLSPAVGEILSSGNFSISGTVIVSADITYDNACDITVSLNLLYNESICETMFVSINSSATGNYIHYECIENICQPVLTEYDSNDPTHYPSPDCDGECISYPPETYSCDNNCYEPILGGLYQTQEQCVNNCDFPEACIDSLYGYDCPICTALRYNGKSSTITDCINASAECETEFELTIDSISINYDCATNTLYYNIVGPDLTDDILDSVYFIGIAAGAILVSSAMSMSGSVVVNTTGIDDLLWITAGNGYEAYHYLFTLHCTSPIPLTVNSEFHCEQVNGTHLLDLSAIGGTAPYFYYVTYVVNDNEFNQYISYPSVWNGSPITLNLGPIMPSVVTVIINDYYNECATIEIIPDCYYICNPDYIEPSGRTQIAFLLDFSGSTTNVEVEDYIADSGGYTLAADVIYEAASEVFDHYITYPIDINSTTGITMALYMYAKRSEIDDDCYEYDEINDPGLINSGGNGFIQGTNITHYKGVLDNTLSIIKPSGQYLTAPNCTDAAWAAFNKAFDNYLINIPNSKNLIFVLSDYFTGGFNPSSIDFNNDPNTIVTVIITNYYPGLIRYTDAHDDFFGIPSNYFPIDQHRSLINWKSTFGTDHVFIMNTTPDKIFKFIMQRIDYYRSNENYQCITVSGEGFDKCPVDCTPTGYTCYNNCMSPVTGGQYTTSGECLEICPTSCQTYLGWGSYICNTNTVEYEIENLNGEYSVDLGICYGYTEGMTYPTGSFVCNEDISTQQSVTINITDSLGCTAQIIVPIICDNNPCESTIAGTFVSGQSSTTTNDCDRVVPPITNNWHCQGEDCTYENIYTSPNGLSGFYEYKYRKIVQGINSCPNSIVAYYAFVPANNKYLAYPTQSKIVVNSNTYYNGSYNVLTSNITPYLSVLSSNNGTINMTVVDDWSIDNVGNDLQVRNYIRDAFDLWGELISYAFGINFSFDMCLWNEPESNTTTSEYKADFYVSMIQPNPIDNLNIFYTGFTANGMPITYDGFGTPLNYTDIALAKGGVIVINSESNANWVSGTPISVSGEVNFKAQIFNFIGHSLGLRSPYYEAAVSSTANTCAPDGCISDCEANSLFSIYNPTTFNTFMAMVLQGADIDSYIVDGLLNDAICVECLQKRYLTV